MRLGDVGIVLRLARVIGPRSFYELIDLTRKLWRHTVFRHLQFVATEVELHHLDGIIFVGGFVFVFAGILFAGVLGLNRIRFAFRLFGGVGLRLAIERDYVVRALVPFTASFDGSFLGCTLICFGGIGLWIRDDGSVDNYAGRSVG